MKKLSVKKEILLVIMIIVMIFIISTKVLATNSPIQIPVTGENNITTNTEDTNVTTNTINTNVITPNTQQNTITNTTGSTYENTTLPQTGDASDYAIFMLIVVSGIVAVYAYKKVREYNI